LFFRKVRQMKRWIGYINSISFRLRWIFMSSRGRYPYLWAKTKKMGDWGYTVRNTVVSTDK
jgi:hypothetical protein